VIENWDNLSPEERMIALIEDMAEDYYRTRSIDGIPEAIVMSETSSTGEPSQEFFRTAIHSSIPCDDLEEDIPIVGMGMMGRSIAFGENKALVDIVSNKADPIHLDAMNSKKLIRDAYERVDSIGAVFFPIGYYAQIHKELDVRYRNGVGVIKTEIDEIRMVYSNNLSKWSNIAVLGRKSVEWTRKLSPVLPPNLSGYQVYSEENEHFQSAYWIAPGKAFFMVGTVSNCRVIDSENIVVYSPREK
jgi:hypothetical protein